MKRAQVEREIGLMVVFVKMHAEILFRLAEKTWQNGYCVQLKATQGPDPKRLGPGQTTHFTIEVLHKPDNAKLDVPVVATGYNGRVDPASKPVPPPAKFSFTAGSRKRIGYPVYLTSTSRRGVGKLSFNFDAQGYKIKIVMNSSGGVTPPEMVTITGTVMPDPSGSFLVGPGTTSFHVWVNSNLGCPGVWKDSGLKSFTLELKATDKGDGNFEVVATPAGASKDLLGNLVVADVTFPVGDGGPATNSGKSVATDDCTGENGTVTITTTNNWTITADPLTG
jgi:hypothetical protein